MNIESVETSHQGRERPLSRSDVEEKRRQVTGSRYLDLRDQLMTDRSLRHVVRRSQFPLG
jgi:hypothetical protein